MHLKGRRSLLGDMVVQKCPLKSGPGLSGGVSACQVCRGLWILSPAQQKHTKNAGPDPGCLPGLGLGTFAHAVPLPRACSFSQPCLLSLCHILLPMYDPQLRHCPLEKPPAPPFPPILQGWARGTSLGLPHRRPSPSRSWDPCLTS